MARDNKHGKGFPVDPTSERKIGQNSIYQLNASGLIVPAFPLFSNLTNVNGTPLDIDEVHNDLIVTTDVHHEIHEGNSYCVGYNKDAVADDAFIELLIQVGPTKELHLIHDSSSGGNSLFDVFEGDTLTGAGTPITAYNSKRTGDINEVEGVFTHTPVIDVAGNNIVPQHFIAGGTGGNAGGGSFGGRDELILNVSTNYRFRITNIAGSGKHVGLLLCFYEANTV